MKIAANGSSAAHAPANSRVALTAAYVGGADVLRVPVRLTADGRAVVAEDDDTAPLAGAGGLISQSTFTELRKLNVSASFRDAAGNAFHAPAMKIEPFALLLDAIPAQPWLLVEVRPEPDAARRQKLVSQVLAAVRNRGLAARTVLAGDADTVGLAKTAAPGALTALRADAAPAAQLQAALDAGADAVVVDLSAVLDDPAGAAPALTPLAGDIASHVAAGRLKLGAMVLGGAVVAPAAFARLAGEASVWAWVADSVLGAAPAFRPGWLWMDEKWAHSAADHEDVNAELWHLGYAKYNPQRNTHVYPDGGIHVAIKPFTGDVKYVPTGDAVQDQMHALLERTWEGTRDWPFYSGGGVGTVLGVEGDFSAEVDVQSDAAQQATTVEMAAINVDPATHIKPWVQHEDGSWHPNHPASFRDKHTFYDPHGAPPFAGVEHDEDDGWRINWNSGTDYDSNQYGKPWGDGKLLTGRMRLDRRGEWWAAYYRPTGSTAAADWVCVGVARNQSLNPRVYLRLAGKRWRQEDPKNPDQYVPVIPNHFVFRNLTLTRYVAPA
jgi:hypothetical protein